MFEPVDLYCERLGPGFWAEPVNAVTNVSFLVAAWFGWMKAKRLGVLSPEMWVLLALICAIGLGSASFHTVANGLTHLLDIVPILVFQLTYLWLYCREVIELRRWTTCTLILAYLAAALMGRQFAEILNGSLMYAPAIVVVFAMGAYHAVAHRKERFVVLAGALVFLFSLLARTIDDAICPGFPLGTHFLWHLLNGLVLYMLMSAYLANRAVDISVDNPMQRSVGPAGR